MTKELTPKERVSNLMMVAAYWRDAYNDAKADLISSEDKKKINAAIDNVKVFLKSARKELFEIRYDGAELTIGVEHICRQIDKLVEDIQVMANVINKQGYRVNVEDYPV